MYSQGFGAVSGEFAQEHLRVLLHEGRSRTAPHHERLEINIDTYEPHIFASLYFYQPSPLLIFSLFMPSPQSLTMSAVFSQHSDGPYTMAAAAFNTHTIRLGWPTLYGISYSLSRRCRSSMRSKLPSVLHCEQLSDPSMHCSELQLPVHKPNHFRLYHWRRCSHVPSLKLPWSRRGSR